MSKTRTVLIGLAGGMIFLYSAAATLAQPPQGPAPGAQQGGPGPKGKAGRGGGGSPFKRAEALHTRLAITPAEDPAFNAWVAATVPPADGPAAAQGLTTPQRLDRQLAQLQARADAAKKLYAALTPQQKQTFDGLPPEVALGGPAPGRGGGKGGGRGGRGGGGAQGGPPLANGGYNPL